MNRITIVETVYHQSGDQPPTSMSLGFGRMLETDELPYYRPRTVATEEWQSVDCGWLKDGAGMVVIQNLGGGPLGKTPTEEQKIQEKSRILEVRLGEVPDTFTWLVRPGESMRGEPKDVTFIRVRCLIGSTRYRVTLFPK